MRIHTGLLIILLLFGIVNCESTVTDEPTILEDEMEPPEIPPIGVIEYDFGALGEIEPDKAQISDLAYDDLENPRQQLSAVLAHLMYEIKNEVKPSIESVLEPVKIDERTFELGVFQWVYDLNTEFYSGIPIESPVKLTAEVSDDGSVEWELVLLHSDNDEVLLLEGYNNQNNTEVRWTLYDPVNAGDIKLAELAYTTRNNIATQVLLSTEFNLQESSAGYTIRYELVDNEAQVTFNNHIDERNFTAFYDYEEGDGSINYMRGDEDREYCWNSDFKLVECESGNPSDNFAQILDIPERSDEALTGSEFKDSVKSLSLEAREAEIYQEVIDGNIPGFLRELSPVSFSQTIDDSTYNVTYYVIPDYLAIGSDEDYFLMPMTPVLAQKISNALGITLPTKKMVDQVWNSASVKLAPSPIPPSSEMTTIPVMWQHNKTVKEQRADFFNDFPPGSLIAGHKKDIIISNRIYGNPPPDRVVIYGWHKRNGDPIQPVYAGHNSQYADYSHGIRLVHDNVLVNKEILSVTDLLQSITFAKLFSDEGVIQRPFYPLGD